MKNPFEKDDHRLLIAGIIVGSVVAGAAAYLFLTETGSTVRQQLAGHLSRMKQSFLGGGSEPPAEEEPEYLKKPHKAPKTDTQQS